MSYCETRECNGNERKCSLGKSCVEYSEIIRCLVMSRKLVVPWFAKGVRATFINIVGDKITSISDTLLQHNSQSIPLYSSSNNLTIYPFPCLYITSSP